MDCPGVALVKRSESVPLGEPETTKRVQDSQVSVSLEHLGQN